MKYEDKLVLISSIKMAILDDPSIVGDIANIMTVALQDYARMQSERAGDMEVALSVAIASRFKNRESLILSKLQKWNGKAALRWDDVIQMLESKKNV